MIANTKIMLSISVLLTGFMIVLSFCMYASDKNRRHMRMANFWSSYGAYFLYSFLSQGSAPPIVALSTVFWIWRLWSLRLILEDLTGVELKKKWHAPSLVLGYTTMVLLSLNDDVPFHVYTSIACLSNCLVGFDCLRSAWRHKRQKVFSINHGLLFFTITFIFLHQLDYPFLRYESEYTSLGFAVVLGTTFLMSILLPAVTIFELQEEQKQKLEELVTLRSDQLVVQSKLTALGKMAANIAHEVYNPLGIIIGRVSHLQKLSTEERLGKEQLDKYLVQIATTADRISRIIKGLKEYSKDIKNTEPQVLELPELISESIFFCQERFERHGIQLIIQEIPELRIRGFGVQITQVLLNLLNNAFEAVEDLDEKWVKLAFRPLPASVLIEVVDSGKGVAPSIREEIFEPFFSTKGSKKGTGLGLSISRKIVEEHRGQLTLDPEATQTTFVMELPLAPLV